MAWAACARKEPRVVARGALAPWEAIHSPSYSCSAHPEPRWPLLSTRIESQHVTAVILFLSLFKSCEFVALSLFWNLLEHFGIFLGSWQIIVHIPGLCCESSDFRPVSSDVKITWASDCLQQLISSKRLSQTNSLGPKSRPSEALSIGSGQLFPFVQSTYIT